MTVTSTTRPTRKWPGGRRGGRVGAPQGSTSPCDEFQSMASFECDVFVVLLAESWSTWRVSLIRGMLIKKPKPKAGQISFM